MESVGMRLAKEIRADRDFPPFEKSLMDGYAVRAEDVVGGAVELPVVEHIAAGSAAGRRLGRGEAMAIMTGAPLPGGADKVVPVEETELLGGGTTVRIKGGGGNRYIAARGSDMRQGEIVLPTGTLMGAAQIAVAASVGAARVEVFRRPAARVLGTGDEIVPIEEVPGPEQIRGSNNAMLVALLEKLGCTTRDLGTCRDDREATRQAIVNGLDGDALFITGGMSMGEKDYVPGILKDLGAEFRITKLRIKPGKPFVFAVMPGGKFVFGLPGNPVSGYVCTLRLASRLLDKLAGGKPVDRLRPMPLAEKLPANGPREFYQPGILAGGAIAPLNWKGSADIFTLAASNALIVRSENEAPKAAGDIVQTIELP
jgi:molybdopterin molybdotransferase